MVPKHHLELLNPGSKFYPSNWKLPFMDIVNTAELRALSLEKETRLKTQNYCEQKLVALLPKANFKIRSNLTFKQRIALKELSQSTEKNVYSYDKGNGFVVLKNKDAMQKIEEQIGESVVSNTDPTSALKSKIQKHLAALCKQQ